MCCRENVLAEVNTLAATTEKICTEIRKVIDDDPSIRDSSHITLTTQKHGFWVFGDEEIVLSGRVRSERERERVSEIASSHAHGKSVSNNLSVRSEP